MSAARYLVVVHPGIPVPGGPFVPAGEVFDAPAGFVPSRTFLPVNLEAQRELEKIGVVVPLLGEKAPDESRTIEHGLTPEELDAYNAHRARNAAYAAAKAPSEAAAGATQPLNRVIQP